MSHDLPKSRSFDTDDLNPSSNFTFRSIIHHDIEGSTTPTNSRTVFRIASTAPSPFAMPTPVEYDNEMEWIYSPKDTPLMLDPPLLLAARKYGTLSPV